MSVRKFQFYQLLTTPLDVALPSLVRKAYASGFRLCITADSNQHEPLSKAMWEQSGVTFIPNCSHDDENAALHPIILSQSASRVNGANVILITNGLEYDETMANFERILFMFDGNAEHELKRARELWVKYQKNGDELVFFKQQQAGDWKNEQK